MLHQLVYKSAHRFVAEDRSLQAAGLTFYTLFALAPLVALGLSLIGLAGITPAQQAQVQDFFVQHFIPSSGHLVEEYIHSFVIASARLSRISSFLFLITTIFLLNSIESCLDQIWQVKSPAVCLTNRFVSYTMVLVVSPLFLGLSVGLSATLLPLAWLQHPAFLTGMGVLWKGLPFLLTWSSITVLYYWLPRSVIVFKHVLFAAFLVAILFELMKYAFQLYVVLFPTYQIVYGALALLPIFLLWIYLSWCAVLFGAILASEMG